MSSTPALIGTGGLGVIAVAVDHGPDPVEGAPVASETTADTRVRTDDPSAALGADAPGRLSAGSVANPRRTRL